ncbi:DnaJ domain protein, partial [Bacteriovorax sp. DB6_IX]
KEYKKIVSLYHPDKWNYYNKTDSIDKRLRENFNIIQKSYDIISK